MKTTSIPAPTEERAAKRQVPFKEWLELKHGLFNDYQNLKFVSKETAEWYLKKFEHMVGQSQSVLGKRIVCTIIPTDKDQWAFTKLPSKLRLYRGYNKSEKREGISWSLSRRIAEGFAYFSFFEEKTDLPPSVVTGTCKLKDVLAYSNSRNEEEIVVSPVNVSDITDIEVRPKPEFPVTAEPLEELLDAMAAELKRKKRKKATAGEPVACV